MKDRTESYDFGALLYEAGLRIWWRILTAAVIACVVFYAAVQVLGWADSSWPQRCIYLCVVLFFPYLVGEALLNRVRFYEREIVHRTWKGKLRRLEYGQVRAVYGMNTFKLTIYPEEGRVIEIPKSEGDLEYIAQIVRDRQGQQVGDALTPTAASPRRHGRRLDGNGGLGT